LVDGTEFDSSYNSGQPIDFPLGRVIQGWVEGIQLVKEGGKIELVMGPDLAYGQQATAAIPANSALVFQVELLKINPEPEPVQQETPEQPPTDG
jgi:FKBP-type peptidyl-prolyl cis-trans isomerase FkpA